jgi:Ca-activated chloride channel family protein
VVLRVAVMGDELAGPQHDAPALAKKADKKGDSSARADSEANAGAGWTGILTAAAVGAVILIAALVLVLVRRGKAMDTARAPAAATNSTRRNA